MPLCPHCHTVVSEDYQFCPECGRPLVIGEAVEGRGKKKLAGIIVGCIIAGIIIAVIANRTLAPTYTLSVSVSPLGAGSVSTSGGEYKSGVQVVLIANPATDYYFDSWSGSASGTTTSVTIIMDSDKSVTANFATTPQAKYTTPGTGAAVGWVMFPDYTPACDSLAYIFEPDETLSFAGCYVDTNGYYIFDDIPPGSYEIYVTSFGPGLLFTGPPDATIAVYEHETTSVPNITVLGNVEIALDNPRIATMPGEDYTSKYIIDGHHPKFTWDKIQNAAYYVVTVWSTYPYNNDYEESQQVVSNMIVWPTSLSSLPYQEFRIDVDAYMQDDTQIASGYELFAIDNPPEGWVYE